MIKYKKWLWNLIQVSSRQHLCDLALPRISTYRTCMLSIFLKAVTRFYFFCLQLVVSPLPVSPYAFWFSCPLKVLRWLSLFEELFNWTDFFDVHELVVGAVWKLFSLLMRLIKLLKGKLLTVGSRTIPTSDSEDSIFPSFEDSWLSIDSRCTKPFWVLWLVFCLNTYALGKAPDGLGFLFATGLTLRLSILISGPG